LILFALGALGVFIIRRALVQFKALHMKIHEIEGLEPRAASSRMLIYYTSRGLYLVVILVLV
jgi:hypothetical protein